MTPPFVVERHALVTSTMDVCRERAELGAPAGLVVVAEGQTAGRGRAGRAWFSPPGQSLYLSILLRPQLLPAPAVHLTMAGAVAVAQTIETLTATAPSPRIKWPNDVLLVDKKVAGVLVESAFQGSQIEYAIVGIGLNVNTIFETAPEEVRRRAVSLQAVYGRQFDCEAVLHTLLERCAQWLFAEPDPALLCAYRARLDTLGQTVALQVGDTVVCGVAEDIRDDGALLLRTAQGVRAVCVGEIA